MAIGVLKPEDAAKRARAAVEKWDAGKRKAEAEARRTKPEPAPAATAAPSAAVPSAPFTSAQSKNRLLISAVKGDDAGLVRTLLGAGADANTRTYTMGGTLGGSFESDVGWPVLMLASWCGRADIVGLLVSAGADVNARAEGGETALMRASKMGNANVAKILIANNADVNAISENGRTALIEASNKGLMVGADMDGRREIVEMLRKAGATG